MTGQWHPRSRGVGPVLAGGGFYAAYMRGPGNGIAQSNNFDKGRYTVSFDVVKQTSYEATAAP